jgi:hypothetical protein
MLLIKEQEREGEGHIEETEKKGAQTSRETEGGS